MEVQWIRETMETEQTLAAKPVQAAVKGSPEVQADRMTHRRIRHGCHSFPRR